MKILRSLPLVALAVLLLAAVACGGEPTSAPQESEAPRDTPVPEKASRAEVLESLTARVILPGYTEAAASLSQLEQSLGALCASPGVAGLQKARQDWRTARQGWLRTESFRFGPAMERRSSLLVDRWPVDTAKIDDHLDGDAITEERVSQYLPATQRGMSAAEHLLFGPGSDALAGGSEVQRRCAYLRSVVAVAGDEVAGVLADWQGTEETAGYAGYYDGTGSLSLLDREAEAIAVRSLVFQVRAIVNMRLAPALGLDGEASTDAIPAGAADNSREDLLNQLGGIAGLYREAEGGFGLSDRVRPLSPGTDARMLDAIESAISAVSDLTGSIIAQLEADQTQVIAAYDRIKELQLILNTEIVSLLGVSVGFADTDGDS